MPQLVGMLALVGGYGESWPRREQDGRSNGNYDAGAGANRRLPQVDVTAIPRRRNCAAPSRKWISGALATDLVNASVKRRFELVAHADSPAEVASIVSAWSTT